MKKCYVAGKLSDPDVCKYLQACHKMQKTAERVRKLGVSVYIPYLDLLSGLQHGYYEYNDFFDNSQLWLDASDFVYLTPGWEKSLGTCREMERAGKNNIPVFSGLEQVTEFIKPVVICIVGESGSGKTLMAEWFEKLYKYHLIQSYTTRPRRTPEENGHTFVSEEEFDKFSYDEEEMIAYTKFGAFRYCCLRKDVRDYNTYVIDEDGLKMLKEKYSDQFHIYSIRIRADVAKRRSLVSRDRFIRDKDRFTLPDEDFDFVYHNSYDLKEMITFVNVTQTNIWADFVLNCLNQ